MTMERTAAGALVAIALAIIPACASDGARQAAGDPPAASATEPPAPGATVLLRAEAPDTGTPSRVVVDVVARGVAELHGAAFRLTWDPEALTFAGTESGGAWSTQALALAKEGSPGQLAVVWAEKGEKFVDASGETVLGKITFEARAPRATALAFKVERSQIVDKTGARIEAKWVGGAVGAR